MIDYCISSSDGESPEVFDRAHPKARKEHVCCECQSIIHAGEIYEKVTGLWEGSWETFKTCKICEAIRGDFFHSFSFGDLWEDLRAAYFEIGDLDDDIDWLTGALQ